MVVFMRLISRVLTSAEETQLSVYRLMRKNVSSWLELLRRVKVRNRGYITKYCYALSLKSLHGANSVKDINLTEKYEQIFFCLEWTCISCVLTVNELCVSIQPELTRVLYTVYTESQGHSRALTFSCNDYYFSWWMSFFWLKGVS